MGKIKGIECMFLIWESNHVAFCGLIMKTMDFFGLSHTAAPDGSLLGYGCIDPTLELLAFGHIFLKVDITSLFQFFGLDI